MSKHQGHHNAGIILKLDPKGDMFKETSIVESLGSTLVSDHRGSKRIGLFKRAVNATETRALKHLQQSPSIALESLDPFRFTNHSSAVVSQTQSGHVWKIVPRQLENVPLSEWSQSTGRQAIGAAVSGIFSSIIFAVVRYFIRTILSLMFSFVGNIFTGSRPTTWPFENKRSLSFSLFSPFCVIIPQL